MGRKKIEIKPLTDERNRNVTFLKRKAGLMKKAWELSVLCGADVSLIIFNSQGKAFEFSSKELDAEVDKYLEYEGPIERRRAPEFEAMAAAGDDGSDDDDDGSGRRGSTSKNSGLPAPTKSLKGKETFKRRQPSREEMSKQIAKAKEDRRRSKGRSSRRRRREGADAERRSFVGELVTEDDSEDDSDDSVRENDRKRRRRREEQAVDDQAGAAGLHYALNMYQAAPVESENGYHGAASLASRPSWRNSVPPPPSHQVHAYGGAYPAPGGLSAPYAYSQSPPRGAHNIPPPPAGHQWDPALLQRYAEFQLQQNHQRQQRLLLERQRTQLAEMGIPVDDTALLDHIFGVSAGVNQGAPPMSEPSPVSGARGSETFEWPTLRSGPPTGANGLHHLPTGVKEHPGAMYMVPPGDASGSSGASTEAGDIPWGVGVSDGRIPFLSPASPEPVGRVDLAKRARVAM